jgi:hypothetical protein
VLEGVAHFIFEDVRACSHKFACVPSVMPRFLEIYIYIYLNLFNFGVFTYYLN